MEGRYHIIRFQWAGETRYGILDRDEVFRVEGNIYDKFGVGHKLCNLSDVRLLPPVQPKNIIGVGGNYLSAVKQVGREVEKQPQLFSRPISTVIGHLENIVYPKTSKIVNYGAELTIVIRSQAWNVPEDKALDYVLGYTCGVDLTAFDLLQEDGFRPFRAKAFPTSQPLGPCVATGIDGDNVKIISKLNDAIIEDGSTRDLIFNISKLVSYISKYIVLEPGDVILTGQMKTTQINIGDSIVVEMEGIGTLKNTVVSG